MKVSNVFKLVIAIAVSELAGVVGSLFTAPSIPTWYATLAKPALNPPSWVFAPVWTTLFALMGVAAFLVWRKGLNRREVKIALGVFLGQLVLNTFWSIIFFGLHAPGWALVELGVLWAAILATIVAFARVSKPAAWLLAPYILWVSFAGYLNYSIWQLSMNEQSQVFCTMEAKQCPDGSYVGRTGPNCEFAPCPGLPSGYTLQHYTVEKTTGASCTEASDCETPGEYLMQSRCPFTSLCLDNQCAVVCPSAPKP